MSDDVTAAWTPLEEDCLLSLVSARVHPWVKWDMVAAIFLQEFGPLRLYNADIVRRKFYSLRPRWRDRHAAPALLHETDGLSPPSVPFSRTPNPGGDTAPRVCILEKISPQMKWKWIREDQLLAEADSGPSAMASRPSDFDQWSPDEDAYLRELAATFDRKWHVLARLMRQRFPDRRRYSVAVIRDRFKGADVSSKGPVGLSVDLFYRFNQENKMRDMPSSVQEESSSECQDGPIGLAQSAAGGSPAAADGPAEPVPDYACDSFRLPDEFSTIEVAVPFDVVDVAVECDFDHAGPVPDSDNDVPVAAVKGGRHENALKETRSDSFDENTACCSQDRVPDVIVARPSHGGMPKANESQTSAVQDVEFEDAAQSEIVAPCPGGKRSESVSFDFIVAEHSQDDAIQDSTEQHSEFQVPERGELYTAEQQKCERENAAVKVVGQFELGISDRHETDAIESRATKRQGQVENVRPDELEVVDNEIIVEQTDLDIIKMEVADQVALKMVEFQSEPDRVEEAAVPVEDDTQLDNDIVVITDQESEDKTTGVEMEEANQIREVNLEEPQPVRVEVERPIDDSPASLDDNGSGLAMVATPNVAVPSAEDVLATAGADDTETDEVVPIPTLTNSHICHFNAFDDIDSLPGSGYESPQDVLARLHYQLQAPEIRPAASPMKAQPVDDFLDNDLVRRAIRQAVAEPVVNSSPEADEVKAKASETLCSVTEPADNFTVPMPASRSAPAADFDFDENDFDLDDLPSPVAPPNRRGRPPKPAQASCRRGRRPAIEGAASKKRGRPRKGVTVQNGVVEDVKNGIAAPKCGVSSAGNITENEVDSLLRIAIVVKALSKAEAMLVSKENVLPRDDSARLHNAASKPVKSQMASAAIRSTTSSISNDASAMPDKGTRSSSNDVVAKFTESGTRSSKRQTTNRPTTRPVKSLDKPVGTRTRDSKRTMSMSPAWTLSSTKPVQNLDKSIRIRTRSSKRAASPIKSLPIRKSRRRYKDDFTSKDAAASTVSESQFPKDPSVNTQQSVCDDDLIPDSSAHFSCDTFISEAFQAPSQPEPKMSRTNIVSASSSSDSLMPAEAEDNTNMNLSGHSTWLRPTKSCLLQ